MSTATNTVDETVDVQAPIEIVYARFVSFETFPALMNGVDEVTRDGDRLRWRGSIGGQPREWSGEITEERPNERIAWRSTDGPQNDGSLSFERLDDSRTRVRMRQLHDPGIDAPALQIIRREAQEDLARFKHHIETGYADLEEGGS